MKKKKELVLSCLEYAYQITKHCFHMTNIYIVLIAILILGEALPTSHVLKFIGVSNFGNIQSLVVNGGMISLSFVIWITYEMIQLVCSYFTRRAAEEEKTKKKRMLSNILVCCAAIIEMLIYMQMKATISVDDIVIQISIICVIRFIYGMMARIFMRTEESMETASGTKWVRCRERVVEVVKFRPDTCSDIK